MINSPVTARRGNQLSAAGMALAVAVTVVLLVREGTVTTTGWIVLSAGTVVGSLFGWYAARTVAMTAMPQLVSLFNAVGGGAAALIAVHELVEHADHGIAVGTSVALDVIIGSVTFTGSLVASGKLQGVITGSPVVFP